MNRNIRIARQLIRLARIIIARSKEQEAVFEFVVKWFRKKGYGDREAKEYAEWAFDPDRYNKPESAFNLFDDISFKEVYEGLKNNDKSLIKELESYIEDFCKDANIPDPE